MNLVSVIIPYFRKKKFIVKAINSILNQKYANKEIIIIYDDNDKSDLEYLKRKFSKNKIIKFLINKKNIGAGQSRNRGIKHAKGKYISFLDSDDFWKKNKLDLQIKFMKKNNYSVSHTSYNIVDINNNVLGFRKAKNFVSYKQILTSCDIGLSTVVLEKKILKKIKFPSLKTKEDFVMWLKLLKKDIPIGGLNKRLSSWKITKNSLSSSTIQKLIDGFTVYNKYLNYSLIISLYYLLCLSLNYCVKKIKC
jgi:teichuronic acid biosynthesis glycosyltransferase TuaG